MTFAFAASANAKYLSSLESLQTGILRGGAKIGIAAFT